MCFLTAGDIPIVKVVLMLLIDCVAIDSLLPKFRFENDLIEVSLKLVSAVLISFS